MLRLAINKTGATKLGYGNNKNSNYLSALNSRKIKKTAMNEQLLQSYAALHAAGLFRQF
jgi:hypothetical protein